MESFMEYGLVGMLLLLPLLSFGGKKKRVKTGRVKIQLVEE